MRNRSIPAFSVNHVGALYRPTLHSAMHSIRRNIQIKKAPQPGVAAGALWRLRRPNGPANLRLKRGYASSNSKTDIELSIFPNPCAPAFPKSHCARPFYACGTACPPGCPTVSMTSREHARNWFFTLKDPPIQNWSLLQQGITFNRANATLLTFAACPALQRPVPARRQYNEAGLPI